MRVCIHECPSIAIGSGYHGTFAFIGDTIQSGDAALLNKMVGYWYPWGLAVIAGYCILCMFLLVLILSQKTLFPAWCALRTPLPIMVLGALVVAIFVASLDRRLMAETPSACRNLWLINGS